MIMSLCMLTAALWLLIYPPFFHSLLYVSGYLIEMERQNVFLSDFDRIETVHIVVDTRHVSICDVWVS